MTSLHGIRQSIEKHFFNNIGTEIHFESHPFKPSDPSKKFIELEIQPLETNFVISGEKQHNIQIYVTCYAPDAGSVSMMMDELTEFIHDSYNVSSITYGFSGDLDGLFYNDMGFTITARSCAKGEFSSAFGKSFSTK